MYKYPLTASLLALAANPALAAASCGLPDSNAQHIETAKLIIEDNKGDGDFSLVGKFGDEDWTELCVFDPKGKLILNVKPEGRMAKLGLGSIVIESHEPEYGEYDYARLKTEWPEGQYRVLAKNRNGKIVGGAATLGTVLPVMPEIIAPATVPNDTDPAPIVPLTDLAVQWKPVTTSQDGRPIEIRGYQILINKENHKDTKGFSQPSFDVHVGPQVTSFTVPKAFFDAQSLYEIEVAAIEAGGNQTIGGASFFKTE